LSQFSSSRHHAHLSPLHPAALDWLTFSFHPVIKCTYIVYIQHAHTTERVWVRTGLSLLLVCQPINRLEKTVVSLAPPATISRLLGLASLRVEFIIELSAYIEFGPLERAVWLRDGIDSRRRQWWSGWDGREK
jgi:hypothetical protein